jgi:DNA-binding NarL/FixJ family response regulator
MFSSWHRAQEDYTISWLLAEKTTKSAEDADLFEAIKSGASGYLLKNLEPNELFDYLARLSRGEAPACAAVRRAPSSPLASARSWSSWPMD